MARKGGKRGGSSAARSAAAKKGWETRRRGGAKAKPAARKATAPTKPKQAAGRRGMPKTTSARGRALTNQRRAADLVRASRGGKGPSAKAVRSLLTAQRARAFYDKTGGGKKRSAVKAAGKKTTAAKAAAVRSRLGGGGSARPKVAGRPRAGATVARPKGVKVTQEQRAIATAMKKSVRSKNIQASRILMKMAARDGHGGDIRGLTSTVASNGRGGWKAVPTRNQRGNQMSAEKSKDLMLDRAPSRRLVRAAIDAADAGRVSQRRLNAVLKASGIDYMAINQGYWRAVDSAKGAFSRRRRRG